MKRFPVAVLAVSLTLTFVGHAFSKDEPSPTKAEQELFGEELRKTVPLDLQAAYAKFVQGTKNDDVTSSCLPHSVSVSREPRPKGKQGYGQDMNLPFLKDRFSPKVRTVRKDPDDTYLIRTATSAIWFVQTKSGVWKIYQYFDKPIV